MSINNVGIPLITSAVYVIYKVIDRNNEAWKKSVELYRILTTLLFKLHCNQTAMSLPPETSAVFLIAKSLRGRLGGISEIPLLPFRG
jgi:hypothetical protein